MPTIYDCDPSELVEKAGEELKKIENIKAPEWAPFVKTGVNKERPPVNSDWWYVRAASVLKQIYKFGPIGVSKLRTKYGGKKNRGMKPEHFYKGSGSIIRKIVQQLEKEGFVKNEQKTKHKGRVITAKGKKFLDGIAAKMSKLPKAEEQKKEVKEQPKEEKKIEQKEVKKETKERGKEVVVQKEEKKAEQKEVKQETKEKSATKAKETTQKETKPKK